MTKRKCLIFAQLMILFLFFTLIFLQSCKKNAKGEDGKETSETKVTKIGAILPLTGPSSYLGQSVRQGMELAFTDFNELNETNFKLDVHDTQGKANIAGNIYRLVQSRESNKIILSWMSSAASNLVELSEKDKIVLFMGAAKPELTIGKEYAIRVWPHALDLAQLEADFAIKKIKSDRAGIFYINDDYGKALNEEFKKIFTKNNGKIVFEEPISPEIIDYKEIVAKHKNKKFDLIYIPAYGKVYLYIIKSIKQYLPIDIKILTDLTFCNYNTLRDLEGISEGIYTVGTEIDNINTKNKKSLSLIRRIKELFNRRADFNSGLGYDMAWIALESLYNSKHKTSAEIVSYILKKDHFDGASGKIYFNDKGDSKYNLYLLTIKNGKLEEVEDSNGEDLNGN